MNKQLSADRHLKGLALFTMARDHYDKCRDFEAGLAELLGYEDDGMFPYMGCLSDEIYTDGGSFATGLKKEGFTLPKPKKR